MVPFRGNSVFSIESVLLLYIILINKIWKNKISQKNRKKENLFKVMSKNLMEKIIKNQ